MNIYPVHGFNAQPHNNVNEMFRSVLVSTHEQLRHTDILRERVMPLGRTQLRLFLDPLVCMFVLSGPEGDGHVPALEPFEHALAMERRVYHAIQYALRHKATETDELFYEAFRLSPVLCSRVLAEPAVIHSKRVVQLQTSQVAVRRFSALAHRYTGLAGDSARSNEVSTEAEHTSLSSKVFRTEITCLKDKGRSVLHCKRT